MVIIVVEIVAVCHHCCPPWVTNEYNRPPMLDTSFLPCCACASPTTGRAFRDRMNFGARALSNWLGFHLLAPGVRTSSRELAR